MHTVNTQFRIQHCHTCTSSVCVCVCVCFSGCLTEYPTSSLHNTCGLMNIHGAVMRVWFENQWWGWLPCPPLSPTTIIEMICMHMRLTIHRNRNVGGAHPDGLGLSLSREIMWRLRLLHVVRFWMKKISNRSWRRTHPQVQPRIFCRSILGTTTGCCEVQHIIIDEVASSHDQVVLDTCPATHTKH